MAERARNRLFDDEYAAVELRLNGGVLSLLLFGLQLLTPHVMRFQPWRPQRIWLWPMVTPTVIFVLATVGLLFGLWGRRRARWASASRIGILLNGIVFAILLLWGCLIFLVATYGRSTVFKPVTPPRRPSVSVQCAVGERSAQPAVAQLSKGRIETISKV